METPLVWQNVCQVSDAWGKCLPQSGLKLMIALRRFIQGEPAATSQSAASNDEAVCEHCIITHVELSTRNIKMNCHNSRQQPTHTHTFLNGYSPQTIYPLCVYVV